MDEVYPVGNTHKSYYDDVLDYFERQGFEPENSRILVVGGELIAWNIKDRFPKSHVESIDVEEKTLELQSGIAERLESGEDPSTIAQQIEDREFIDSEKELGTTYPEIVAEIGDNVLEPDNSRVEDIESYRGEADMVISNNVSDYAFNFMDTIERVDPDYVEIYTIHPIEHVTSEYDGRLEPDVNPDVDFWWTPGGRDGNVDVILYSEQN